jgi:hypothetical protein
VKASASFFEERSKKLLFWGRAVADFTRYVVAVFFAAARLAFADNLPLLNESTEQVSPSEMPETGKH